MHDMILKSSIHMLMQKKDLDQATCKQVLQILLEEKTNTLQAAAFLVLLRTKTETADELLGFIQALRENMIPVKTNVRLLDIVGTGGDHENTLNISTGSAILAASCGVKIAKHGNRAVSSLAGSADVLEALGINLELNAKEVAACIEQIGIGFCYSPQFHPAFLRLKTLRRELNVPTTLNILGPLLNPASPEHLILGTFDEALMPLLAQTVQKMGTKHAMIVHGHGLDEISCIGPTRVIDITASKTREMILDPQTYGLSRCRLEDLRGKDAGYNAQLLLDCFSGYRSSPSQRAIADTLILNAAVALHVYGIHPSLQEAVEHADNNLRHGTTLELLKAWVEFSQKRCLL